MAMQEPGFTPINIPNITPIQPGSLPVYDAAAMSAKQGGNVADLLKGLQAAPDLSKVQADPNLLSFLSQITTHPQTGYDFSNFANAIQNPYTPKAAAGAGAANTNGHSDILGQVLNDTLGQIGGLVRTTLGKEVDDVKNTWNSNAPWWQKGLGLINDTLNPVHVANNISDSAWNAIQDGAQQQQKDWSDPNASLLQKAGLGFLDGASNSWTSGQQLLQKTGVQDLMDKVLNNSDIQQNTGQWWQNAGNDFSHGNILGGLGNALGGATLGLAGDANQVLSKMNGTWVNKIPLLGQLPMMADNIMHMNPKGHQGIDQVAGLGTEILTDPLTYLDGAGIATKMGKVAELNKMDELAKAEGLGQKFNNMMDFHSALQNKYGQEADAMKNMAQLNRSKQLAQNYGIDPNSINHPNDLLNEVQSMLGKKYPNLSTVTPNTIQKIQDELNGTGNIYQRLADQKVQGHLDTVNAARAEAANGALNTWGLSVPFSNKTLPLGRVPEKILGIKNPLHMSEATLGDKNLYVVKNLIDNVAKNDPSKAAALENAIKARYGVNDLQDLTKTHIADLTDKLQPILGKTVRPVPDATTTSKIVERQLKSKDFNRLMDEVVAGHVPWKDVQQQLDAIIKKVGGSPTKRSTYGATAAQMVADYWRNAPVKNFNKVANARKAESMEWVANWLKDSAKYQKVDTKIDEMMPKGNTALRNDMTTANNTKSFQNVLADLKNSQYTKVNNAKTAFDHFVDGRNPFNARTLGTPDKYTNSWANHIADMNSGKVGLKAQYGSNLKAIEDYIKKHNIQPQDMTDAIYHLEGKAPKSYGNYGQGFVPSDKVKGLADLARPMLDKITAQEQKAGVLNDLRNNYFPHIVNKDDAAAFKDFVDRHPELQGLKSTNRFNKQRTGFQTLADAQDHIDSLSFMMRQTTDPAKLQDLQDQVDRVRNMYDTNIPSALTKRMKSGVQAMVNKGMQDEFKKFGALVSNPRDASHIPPNSTRLDKAQAAKFGLDPNGQHYLNNDVLKGLERTDGMFNAQGMNKFVRNVQAITDIFRSGVTTFKFSHYRNNIIQNVINNIPAGVRLSDYKQAGKMLQRMRNNTMTASDKAIIEDAYKHNVISGGFVTDLLHGGGIEHNTPTWLEGIAKKVTDFKPAKMGRGNMEKIDDVGRLANYINGLKKFGDSEKAANQVRTYQFNYNELTNADRNMRVAVPFWNWFKRNIPLQFKNLMERPALALNFERTKDTLNQGQQGADWQKDSGIKIPGMPAYTTLTSPTDDLKQFFNPLQMLGSMNPVVTAPYELAANRNIYTGNPISFGSKTTKAQDIPGYLAKQFGITGNVTDLLGALMGANKKTPSDVISNYFNPETAIAKGKATVPIQP